MTLALLPPCQEHDFDNHMTDQTGNSIDQNGLSPVLRRMIDKSTNRHRLNYLFVLWPPLFILLDCIARRICDELPPSHAEEFINRTILHGLKAADGVGGYSEPAWPMRVVEAFAAAVQESTATRLTLPCSSAGIMCGSQPYCSRVQVGGGESGLKKAASRTVKLRTISGKGKS